jgi:hypothetical protein
MHPQIYSTNRATLIDLKAIRFTVAEDGTSQKIVAFRKLNLNRFKELLAIAGASTDEVEVMRGCGSEFRTSTSDQHLLAITPESPVRCLPGEDFTAALDYRSPAQSVESAQLDS